MGRKLKRVALDFEWELDKVWKGYDVLKNCLGCEHNEDGDYVDLGCSVIDNSSIIDCPYYEDPPSGEGWQVWETVSEGSPVTPVFASSEELVKHLCTVGAGTPFEPCSEKAAREFIKRGGAVSTCIIDNRYKMDGINALDPKWYVENHLTLCVTLKDLDRGKGAKCVESRHGLSHVVLLKMRRDELGTNVRFTECNDYTSKELYITEKIAKAYAGAFREAATILEKWHV